MVIFTAILFVVILVVITSLIGTMFYPRGEGKDATMMLLMPIAAALGSFLGLWLVFHLTWWIAVLLGIVAGGVSFWLIMMPLRLMFIHNSRRKFEYHFATLSAMLNELTDIINSLPRQPESEIKDSQSIYSTYVAMKGHWHAYEDHGYGAHFHIKDHFQDDHHEAHGFRYTIQSDGRGQINVIASTKEVGLQHFIWRTEGNRYILMLSDDVS